MLLPSNNVPKFNFETDKNPTDFGGTVKLRAVTNAIYLGNQIEKRGSARCYGLLANESFLLISEYGESGADAEVVFYQKLR